MFYSDACTEGRVDGFITKQKAVFPPLALAPTLTTSVALARVSNTAILGKVTAKYALKPGYSSIVTLLVMPDGMADVDIILSTDWMVCNKSTPLLCNSSGLRQK
jgi:hypothetical protein